MRNGGNPMFDDPMNQLQGGGASSIPMFNSVGTALSQEERENIAKKKGICVHCGIKTHEVKMFNRKALTNEHVYQGICIKDNSSVVPRQVFLAWEQKFRPPQAPVVTATEARLRGAARRAMNIHRVAGPSHANLPGESSRGGSGSGSSGSSSRAPPSGSSSRAPPGGSSSRTPPPPAPRERFMAAASTVAATDAFSSPSGRRSGGSSGNNLNVTSSPSSSRGLGSQRDLNNSDSGDNMMSLSERSGGAISSSTTPSNSISLSSDPALRDEDYTGGASSSEDARTVVRGLRDYRDQPRILKQKLHRLRNLADDRGAGAVDQLKELMEFYNRSSSRRRQSFSHQDSGGPVAVSRVLAACAGALWGVTANKQEQKIEATDSGIIADLLDAMRKQSNQSDVRFLFWGAGCLACLARGGSAPRSVIADFGGIEVILNSLTLHPQSAGMFEWSCRSLHALVHQDDDEGGVGAVDAREATRKVIRKNIDTFTEANGVSVVMDAIKNHVSEGIAQESAVSLLWRCQDCEMESSSRQVLQKMLDADGISTCVKLLKARSTSMTLYALTSSLLYNMCAVYLQNAPIVPEAAIECLPITLRMMREYPDDERLQESCCMLISAIAAPCKLQIKESNGLSTVVNAMSRFPMTLSLQEASSSLLWTLSYIPAFFDYSIVGEALRTLKVATEAHPDELGLLTNTCGVIANVVLSTSITSADIPVQIPILALGLKSDDPDLLHEASRALSNICMQSSNLAAKVIKSNGIEALCSSLDHATNEALPGIFAALSAISSMSDENKATLMQADILTKVKSKVQACTSAAIVEKGLMLLATQVASEKRSAIALPGDILVVIIQSMKTVLKKKEERQKACKALQNLLSVSTPGARNLFFDGVVEILCNLINEKGTPVELKRDACRAMWALVGRHADQDASDLSAMFAALNGVMALYKGEELQYNAGIQSAAAGAMAVLTYAIRENQIPISVEDVESIIAVIYMVMEYDLENTQLLSRYLEIILNLSLINEGTVIQSGGIVVVIDTMVEHEQFEEIQELGCAVLALLSSSENLQVNLCIAETDGIDMIVGALADFPTNQKIQLDACKALSHLSVDQESRMLIASQGGIMLVVNAMSSARENVELLEGACAALLNLSSDAEEQVLADSSVIQTVIELMTIHLDAPKLQEKALGVLQNVSMRNSSSKSAIATSGGIDSVTASIREYMGSPSVLERAFTTMWSLAVLERNQVEIANAGGINLVVNGMMANINYEKVQKQACGCLCTLSSNSRNKTLIREAGGVDAIVYAMWAHYGSEMLQTEACRALSSLAVNVQTNEVMIASDGEINAIITAMKRFPDSPKLQEHACVAIRNFMLSQDNASLIRSNATELRKLMQNAAVKFPQKCEDRASQVLASLG